MNETILGIDFGTKRVGVAIARGPLAEPLVILANDTALISQIAEIVTKEQVKRIVVGLSENKMAEQTKQFADKLTQHLDIPIHFIDETLSSYEMHHKMRLAKRSKKQAPIDHLVAAQLLQDWIDTSA